MNMTQVGSFFIHDSLMYDGLEIVQKIMGEVVVVSCIHNYGYGRFEYIAYSSHFRVVPRDGSSAPRYVVESTMGVITFKELTDEQ
jgi:hypothetical protein